MGAVSFDAAAVIVNEITLVGSRCGRFEPALELLENGRIDFDAMISERMPLACSASICPSRGEERT